MLVYTATKTKFLEDVFERNIEDIVSEAVETYLGKKVGKSEYQSWANSLPQVENILRDEEIPSDVGVAIEYSIPRTQNRIDIVLTGKDAVDRDAMLLIELKQWSKAEKTAKDGMVNTRFANGNKDTLHPSYQAWSYATLLNSFNRVVYENEVQLRPCAFLHNYDDDGILTDEFYSEYTSQAPLFFKTQKKALREFIKSNVKTGDKDNILSKIENSEMRPSKQLADQLSSMIKGNREFILIDSQKEVFEEAKALEKKARTGRKQVLLVRGGPGTGKTVVAINLLADFTKTGSVAQYVTRNSAPRLVYEAKLTGSMKRSKFSLMFQGSGTFHSAPKDTFDALIVDEAHRLNYKSGMFGNLGENQVKEIINAANFSIFFLDEEQRVTLKDIGSEDEIRHWANELDADIQVLDLLSQFRCSGSDGYMAWLDNSLGIRDTANVFLGNKEYDFRVYDNPNKLRHDIICLNEDAVTARIVAGYCWPWITKNSTKKWKALTPEEQRKTYDITFPQFDFKMRWNLEDQGQSWLIHPESINEIGCIHTCQGLEVDYIGVIIGDDFIVRDGEIKINPAAHPGTDKALQTWKRIVKEEPDGLARVESVIKNTYRTLMSRGMKGCFIYCDDKETADYFKSRVTKA